jgi:hypothetical protein
LDDRLSEPHKLNWIVSQDTGAISKEIVLIPGFWRVNKYSAELIHCDFMEEKETRLMFTKVVRA